MIRSHSVILAETCIQRNTSSAINTICIATYITILHILLLLRRFVRCLDRRLRVPEPGSTIGGIEIGAVGMCDNSLLAGTNVLRLLFRRTPEPIWGAVLIGEDSEIGVSLASSNEFLFGMSGSWKSN